MTSNRGRMRDEEAFIGFKRYMMEAQKQPFADYSVQPTYESNSRWSEWEELSRSEVEEDAVERALDAFYMETTIYGVAEYGGLHPAQAFGVYMRHQEELPESVLPYTHEERGKNRKWKRASDNTIEIMGTASDRERLKALDQLEDGMPVETIVRETEGDKETIDSLLWRYKQER